MTFSLWNLAAYSLQLFALTVAAIAAVWMVRLRAPRATMHFWHVILLAALVLPLLQPGAAIQSERFAALPNTVAASPEPRAAAIAVDLNAVALAILLAGMTLRLLWLGLGLIRVKSLVTNATAAPPLRGLSEQLNQLLGTDASVLVTDDLEGPATIGLFRPVVLLPRSVLGMSCSVQRAIICHELVHVRRRDWMRTIAEEVWCALLWFHPAARAIAARLSLARETVVDEISIDVTRDRRAYAEALLAFSNPQPHVIGVTPFIGRRTLSQRIALIAKENPMSSRRTAAFTAALVVAATLTATAAANVPMSTAARSQVYESGPGITLPVVIHEVKPDYAPGAMQRGVQGSLYLSVVVGETGDVASVTVSKSLDEELDAKSIEAAAQWKFKPGMREGKPVAVRVTVEMTFTLK